MSTLRSDILINPSELFDLTVSSNGDGTQLGQRAVTGDGRAFRYVLAGATALVPGNLQQNAAEATSLENLSIAAAAVGDTSITTTSTVTVTANQLAGGYVIVTVTPGQGYMYQIAGHAAATAAVVTLNLTDPIQVALTTSSKIDLVPNPYSGVIVNPTTATGMPIGVAVAAVPATYYGWVQTEGVASILADGNITVGTQVIASNGTAGAVEPQVAGASSVIQANVGTAMTGIATTEYGAVQLILD